ncbi:class I SAM-dependent methyltransferase [Candidatus Parcubacteria bacterium]|nr:MAG: class I SAM-dependent methyltransferase [Candidatus Parcubacteria bacterium]
MAERSYDFKPGSYDVLSEKMLRQATTFDSGLQRRLSGLLHKLQPGAKVLDVGAGAGIESIIIEKSGRKAFPLEFSSSMLKLQEVIGVNVPENGFLRRRIQGDIFSPPYKLESFDAGCVSHMLQLGHTGERIEVLENVHRLLKDNGRLFVVTEECESLLNINGKIIKGKESELLKIAQPYIGKYPVFFAEVGVDLQYLEQLLYQTGFRNIVVEKDSKNLSRWKGRKQIFAEAQK